MRNLQSNKSENKALISSTHLGKEKEGKRHKLKGTEEERKSQ